MTSPAHGARLPWLLGGLVLVLGLLLTALATRAVHTVVRTEGHGHFVRVADSLESELGRRFARVDNGLSSIRAAWAVTQRLDDADLATWVGQRDMPREFPGVRAFGIVERVPRAQAAAFEARWRAALPHARLQPAPGEADLLVVRSVQPARQNQASLGFDAGGEPLRRAAIEAAIDGGRLVMTPALALHLPGAATRTGWVAYLPVYEGRPADAAQRRAALRGVLFAAVVADELLGPLGDQAGPRVGVQVLDGAPPGGRLVFDALAPWQPAGPFRAERLVMAGDRVLTLSVRSHADLLPHASRLAAWAVAAGGIVLSALGALVASLLATSRLQALAAASEASTERRRLASIVERSDSAVFVAETDGTLAWCNAAFEALAGRPLQALAGQPVVDMLGLPPTAKAAALGALRADIAAGRPHRAELQGQRPDGSAWWAEVSVQVENDGQGQPTGWVGLALDVTARKQAELQLRSREHMLRTITDNLPARISYWDAQGLCLFANRRFCEVYGLRQEQVILQHAQAIFTDGRRPDPAERTQGVLDGMPQQFEQELQEAGGRRSTWQVHYLPDLEGDAVRGFFALAIEVTELQRVRDAALQASQAKSRFLSNMSHEIRTPMNAILGMLTLLRATPLSARQADYAVKAEGAARSLLSLLNDVLDFSKIEAGKMQLDSRPFSLERLLADLSVILAANVGSKDLEVLYELDPAVPDGLLGDDMRLRQVLINLGGNAVKFTGTGVVLVRTRLLARSDAHATIEFSVQDTGIGMSAEQLARIADDDYVQASGETARHYGGTGLGLGICRRLVALMGSTLQVDSRPGEGSRFWFQLVLPVRDDASAPPGPAPVGIERVLVVDDNEVARASLAALARAEGWQADTADGTGQALARLDAARQDGRPYDAVFVDWRMPGLDGWEAAMRIRQQSAAGRRPLLVMVTAQGREVLGQQPQRQQALLDGFLVKPVTAAMLREVLARAQGQAQVGPVPPARDSQPLAGLRLLVAEDNPVNQQICRELLGALGAHVEVADHGQAAVDRLAAGEHYDAVLMDMLMPVMDGLEATRRIRGALGLRALPVVALTANAMDTDRAECLAAGMDDHVGKPMVPAEVVQVLLRLLQREGAPPPSPPAATAAPGASPAPLLDAAGAIERLGGDVALYERLLPAFRANLQASAAQLAPLRAGGGSPAELVRLLHTLKGMGATLGALVLAEAAGRAEAALKAGQQDAGGPAVQAAQAAVDRTLAALGSDAGNLRPESSEGT